MVAEFIPTEAGQDTPQANPEHVLRRLELQVTRRLDGLLHGEYRGFVPGHGSERGETREYQAGDDVRRMDWNVTARLNSPHVRDQIADRELEAWLVVDLSPSLDFGTIRWEKRDLALAATASIGFLSARSGNRVGAVLASGGTTKVIPPKQGRRHLMSILSNVQNSERHDSGQATLGTAINRAATVSRRRGFVCVVSDFLDPLDSWTQQLGVLRQRHDTLAVEVIDPRELDLPDVGFITLVDPETNRLREVNTSDRKLRERYAEASRLQRAEIAQAIRNTGADHLRLSTDSDWLLQLVRHISTRRHLSAQVRGPSS